jgi:hypothetical protein
MLYDMCGAAPHLPSETTFDQRGARVMNRLSSSANCRDEKRRVLIVSAELATRSLEDAVCSSGYSVAGVANSAKAALDSVACFDVDAVLLNSRRFPGWLNLAASLREQGIPVALVTSAHESLEGQSYLH